MDYGVVTDYWANGTVPTVYCQMHTTQRICLDSGMAASPYCYNVADKGVISIPYGHPLYQFINTRYDGVLEEHLGAWATVKFDGSGNVISGGETCTMHNSSTSREDYVMENTLLPDARLLVQQARTMLAGLDPNSTQYYSVYSAMTALESVINSGSPSTSQLASAMGQLTRAMAGLN